MMLTHELIYYIEVEFDDGTKREIPWPDDKVYFYQAQKSKYITRWLEELITKENITAKPLFVRELFKVVECAEYEQYISV